MRATSCCRRSAAPASRRLKRARVLVIGAGGLGAPVLEYLAAAGVGTLGLVDDDVVSLSNLQRQVIHDTQAVGLAKTDSAANAIARINPHVSVERHALRLTAENAAELIRRLRHRRRRVRQFRHALCGGRCLRGGAKAAGDCRCRPLRRFGHGA